MKFNHNAMITDVNSVKSIREIRKAAGVLRTMAGLLGVTPLELYAMVESSADKVGVDKLAPAAKYFEE
jgi:hypothetical protein